MKSSGVFLQNSEAPAIFGICGIIFLKKKIIEYVHSTVDRIHRHRITGLRTSLNADCWFPDQWLGLNQANQYLCSGV
jgi:hypothetical protein